MGNRPYGALVETVSRLKFYPVCHRVANVVITGSWRMVAGAWSNVIAPCPKAISGMIASAESCRVTWYDPVGVVAPAFPIVVGVTSNGRFPSMT